MKKLKYKIIPLLLISLVFTTACSERSLEDISTTNILLNENSIKTRFDLEASVKGIYALMRSPNGIASNHMSYQELTADLAFVSSSNSGYFVETNGGTHITPDGITGSMWNSFYYTISQANFLLSFEGKIVNDNQGLQSVEQLFAHTKAIRALNFFMLLTYYSPNYGEGDQNLGVPYPTTYDKDAKLPREKVETVVNNIIADLKVAIAADPGKISGDGYNNFLNKTALQLLLARVYLYKKDYPSALSYAVLVENDPGSQLLPRQNSTAIPGVANYFKVDGEKSPETLFQIELDSNNNNGNNGLTGYWGTISTYSQNFMARDFYNQFNAGDIRRNNWYLGAGKVSGEGYQNDDPRPIDVKKYTNVDRDIVVFRKTEAIFIKAEALYHSNPSGAAQVIRDWMKVYRQTSYVSPATSGPAVLDEILKQKGFEFFLEGLRFSDLKRNNMPIVKKQASLNLTIPAGDRRFIWPIPLSEMQTNPNIVQAPGY